MNIKGTVAFDIIGTCFSLDLPRTRLVELGAPTNALQLWFAQTLRDAFALSLAGGYQPLLEVLKAELPRTLEMMGVSANYALPYRHTKSDIWMVAVHAWDIAEAARAGLKTVFITQEEKEYLSIYPQPEIVASNLVEAANKIIKYSTPQRKE